QWTGEFPIMTRAGVYRRMHFHAGPVRDASGKTVGLVCVASDADARVEAAAQLSLYQAAIGQSPIGVGVYDAELRYVRANDALLQFIGLPIEEVLHRRVEEVLG